MTNVLQISKAMGHNDLIQELSSDDKGTSKQAPVILAHNVEEDGTMNSQEESSPNSVTILEEDTHMQSSSIDITPKTKPKKINVDYIPSKLGKKKKFDIEMIKTPMIKVSQIIEQRLPTRKPVVIKKNSNTTR